MTYEEKRKLYLHSNLKLDSIDIKDAMYFFRDRIWATYTTNGKKYDIWVIEAKESWPPFAQFSNLNAYPSYTLDTKDGLDQFYQLLDAIVRCWEKNPKKPCTMQIDDEIYIGVADLVEVKE